MSTTTLPTLDDFVWNDQTVQVVDSQFPARLDSQEAGLMDEVRVFVCRMPDPGDHIDYAMIVFDKGIGDGPTIALVDWVLRLDTLDHQRSTALLENSGEVSWAINGGCGCGSTLRSFNPWGVRMIGIGRPELPWRYED